MLGMLELLDLLLHCSVFAFDYSKIYMSTILVSLSFCLFLVK